MEKESFRHRIRLRHLHCFIAIAQERNLGRAAERLRLTQPAVSKTLSELEDIVGVRLFERNRLGAQLTPEGEQFLAHAVSVLEALDGASNVFGGGRPGETEVVLVGALPTVGPDLLPLALESFRRAHPKARVVIQTAANATLLQMLKAGEVDVVLGRMADPQLTTGLSFEMLYADPLVLAVRTTHPLAGPAAVAPAELAAFPFVLSPKGTMPRQSAESVLRSLGLAVPDHCTETLSVSIARQIVRHSDAIWFTPLGAVKPDLADASLRRLALSTAGSEEPVGLLRRSEGQLSSATLEFIRALRDAVQGTPAGAGHQR